MASSILYPPAVDSYMPAFKAGDSCKILFSLSKFNGRQDFQTVHVVVTDQIGGANAVDKSDRTRSTGIILNKSPEGTGQDNVYSVTIIPEEIKGGWKIGCKYKVQLRLSSVIYDPASGIEPAEWLKQNASNFSEWSTVCVIKATDSIYYSIPLLDIDTAQTPLDYSSDYILYASTLNIAGRFNRLDQSEHIKSYCLNLYNNNDTLLESSGEIFTSYQINDEDNINYTFKTELENGKNYKLEFKFETNNYYVGGFYKSGDLDTRFLFQCSQVVLDPLDIKLVFAENDENNILADLTTVHDEEEEGRIGMKLYHKKFGTYSGNICIRRSDSRSDFKLWDDIKIITLKNEYINNLDIIYDYTIESGVWYKYGIQAIDKNGDRGALTQFPPIMRNFEYSYLLGENDQQLKLKFDNTMGNFRYQVTESVTDTIGGRYPIATRNAATMYRTFPLNGLISFWMDDNELFCNKKVIYSYEDVINLYDDYNTEKGIMQYDYIYERDFRQKVLDFLYDGKLKLFKSPTEGNIIVRLMDINCTPNQSLDRMIYSFSATAYEIQEPTMANYLANGFYVPGTYEKDFSSDEYRIGQLQIDLPVGTNLIQAMIDKYDSEGRNDGGYSNTIVDFDYLDIIFDLPPMKVVNSAGEVISGYNFIYNGKTVTINAPYNEYVFDERLDVSASDILIIQGDKDNVITSIPIVANFVYVIKREEFVEKEVQSKTVLTGIGQLHDNYAPGANLYKEIYYKYYIEDVDTYRRMTDITSLSIEANPGVLIEIQDKSENEPQLHEVNSTGFLDLHDLSVITSIVYKGTREDENKKSDLLVNYEYIIAQGSYNQ